MTNSGCKVTQDAGTAARRARYGNLPERIRCEDMTEEVEAAPRGGADVAYDPAGASFLWARYAAALIRLSQDRLDR
ncbi:hypothetical protein [Streptomyces griseorubiginosus]|uniref:hypothetical protein n=1 Tax=Streptomyces griseorubiginosus TaxID=67304 RepID=UPI0036E4DA70